MSDARSMVDSDTRMGSASSVRGSDSALEIAAMCFTAARGSLIEGAKWLHEISLKELWKEGGYTSFSEYLALDCKISDSFAAKLVAIYSHYCVEGKLPATDLSGIDSEKLYLAAKADAPVKKQIAMAATLTRQELKAQLAADKNGGSECEHPEDKCGKFCTLCWSRRE